MLLHGGVQPGFWFQRLTPEPCSQCGNPRRLLQFFFPLSLAHVFLSPQSFPTSFSLLFLFPFLCSPLFLFFQPVSLVISLCFFRSSSLSPVSFLPFSLTCFLLTAHLPTPLPFLSSSPISFLCVCVSLFPTPWPLSLHLLPIPLCSLFFPLFASSLLSPFPFIIQAWQEVTWGWLD